MKRVELYARVRHAVMIDGLSQREAARRFGIDPRTVKRMLSYSVRPGYVRTKPLIRPKLDPFSGSHAVVISVYPLPVKYMIPASTRNVCFQG
jgi:hypothetical protein